MEGPRRVLGGRYELREKQGEGGMGQVYCALDLLKNRIVAVKLLAEEVCADPVVRERFRREAGVLKDLVHPSLVTLHDAVLEGKEPFLVFEFVEGQRLDRVIGGKPMEVRKALSLAAQIASALSPLHERQVVHRDVKPDNIMLRSDGSLCLLDFGTAKRFGDAERTAEQLTTEGFVIGTLQYMPPEALFKNAPLAATYDVWSCGVLLWEMLVGSRPFADVEPRGMTAFMDALRDGQVPPIAGALPDLPVPVVQLVRSLMERRPEDRPPDGAAMQGMIEQAQAALDHPSRAGGARASRKVQRYDTPISNPVYRPGTGSTQVMRRPGESGGPPRRTLIAAGMAALVLAGAAGMIYLRSTGRGRPGGDRASAEAGQAEASQGHGLAMAALERVCQRDPAGLVQRMLAAGRAVQEDAPDAGRAAYREMLARAGITAEQLAALEAARQHLATVEPTGPEGLAIVRPLLGMEYLDQFAAAVELPAGFRLDVARALPPGYQQRAVPAGETDLTVMKLPADGRGAGTPVRFTVADPERVSAVWLALHGDALHKGHVVLVKLNDQTLSMGGLEPVPTGSGVAMELRRGIPARLLRTGENRLDARVLGAPAGAPHDPEGLKLALRVRTS